MFDLPCPKRFLRLSTAMLAMVTYRCMLPPKTGGREKENTNTTLSGLRVVRFICFFVLFCFMFCVLCNPAHSVSVQFVSCMHIPHRYLVRMFSCCLQVC